MNDEIFDLTKKWHNELDIEFDQLSVFRLHILIHTYMKSGEEIKEEWRYIWGVYLGECLCHVLEGFWTEHDEVEIYDGRILNPFEMIDDQIQNNKSVIIKFKKLMREYFNNKNDELTCNEEGNKIPEKPFEIIGLPGFIRIDNAEDVIVISELKIQAKQLIGRLKKIDKNIESYNEYNQLIELPVTDEEFEETMAKLKSKIAVLGDAKIIFELGKKLYENPDLRDIKESIFWLSVTAKKGVKEAESLLELINNHNVNK